MLNWIDYAIIAILLFYAGEGYAIGAIPAFFDLLQFSLSFFAGLQLYRVVSVLLIRFFPLPQGIAGAVSFFLVAFLCEFFLNILFRMLYLRVAQEGFIHKPQVQKLNRFLGILPGMVSGLVLVMFLLTVIAAMPTSPFLKSAMNNAQIGSILLARSQLFEKQIGNVFGQAANDTLNFLTVEPESNQTVSLNFTYANGVADPASENQMLIHVNSERANVGLPALVFDFSLQKVARDHAQDMLRRGYFSHYTPEGLSPFDRMSAAGIQYTAAGENLAFSPNETIAMQGLMNSPGHRANILSKDFGRVGIGVIDAGVYGEMFVQEFTN